MKQTGQTLQVYNPLHDRRRAWLIMLMGLMTGSVIGCGPATSMKVLQPGLLGAQRQLYLASEQAFWAESKTAGRVLVEFPLPGASTGRATYLLYVRLPASEDSTNTTEAREDVEHDAETVGPCGFFIQVRGEDAGLTRVSGGTIQIRHRNRHSCKIVLKLECEDGTQIEGEVLAKRNEPYVNLFERENRPADVQRLITHCATQPSPSG
jgi:hypothetical protein